MNYFVLQTQRKFIIPENFGYNSLIFETMKIHVWQAAIDETHDAPFATSSCLLFNAGVSWTEMDNVHVINAINERMSLAQFLASVSSRANSIV